jgi:CHAT domain-containing protein
LIRGLTVLSFLSLLGCRRVSLQQLYDDGRLQLQQGHYEKVIPEAAEGIHRSGSDPLWNWKFRILEAEALMRGQRVKQSLDLLAEDPPAGLPLEIRARKKIVYAQALCRDDKNKDGSRQGMALLEQVEKLLPGSSPLQAELAFNRGYCSFDTPAVARRYFEKAAELAGGNPFLASSSYGNIGDTYLDEHHYDQAIESYQKVLPFAQAVNSPLLQEKTLGKLGNSYASLGDFKRAVEYIQQAKTIAAGLGRVEDEEVWMLNLAWSYSSLPGDYPDDPEPIYLTALSLARQVKDKKSANTCLHDLVNLGFAEHNLDKARFYWQQEVANISPGDPGELDAWLDEANIAIAESNFGKATDILKKIDLDPRTPLARRAVIESLWAQAYWQEKKPTEALRLFRQSVHTVQEELVGTNTQYWPSILDTQSHRFDNYIRFLVDQGQPIAALDQVEYQRQLGQDLRLPSHRSPLNVAAIQRSLTRDQVILDYHVTDDESFLWVITAKGTQLFHLPPHRELHYLLDAHNNEIQGQRSIEDSPEGQKLYQALIQPAEKLIPRGAHVSIIPSKILWLLNFETLIVPGPKPHYWIEDVTVQNCNSLSRASASAGNLRPAAKQMLLMGAPEEVNPEFPTLKHASEEIGKVKTHFSLAQELVISGSSATPQAYLSSDPQQYRLIHFVTHGIPNETIPMESAIVLSGAGSTYKLYARDIIAKPIHADLVTISACYGAGKRWYIAEGMVGLGWAFIRAGARQVIAALWEVDDSTTPALMDILYTELDRHHTAAEALRTAKLAMLHSSGPQKLPYYWGSLQLYARL